MKKGILITITLLSSTCLLAQIQTSLFEMQPAEEYENIHVQKLSSDTLASCFLIWVKKSVKAHKHVDHTENIYLLEGEGEMYLGEKKLTLKPGDFVNIPKNTVHSVEVKSSIPMKVLSVQAPVFLGKDRVFID